MPIETVCPHCDKVYRLKDELAGKRVTCGNQACRKIFAVPAKAASNGPSFAEKANKAPFNNAEASIDAEALASAALADDPDTAENRVITMKCDICEHQWPEAWERQGKNVLCPECRHRQKVPVTKKESWRGGAKPSLAKHDKLEGVIASQDSGYVSGEVLKKTGVIKDNIEPRPRWHYVAGFGFTIASIALAVFVWQFLLKSRNDGQQEKYLYDAVAEMNEAKDTLNPIELPLFRAGIQVAAGEFTVRKNEQSKLKDAISHFSKARQELTGAAAGIGRSYLFTELAVAQIALGGNQQQIDDGIRIRWAPQATGTGRSKVNEKTFTVLEELNQTCLAMRPEGTSISVIERHWLARRVGRTLAEAGQVDLIAAALRPAFADNELAEGLAHAGLEAAMVSKENLASLATEVVTLAQTNAQGQVPAVQAFCQIAFPEGSTEVASIGLQKPPQATGTVSESGRQTFTMIWALQKKSAEALELARRSAAPENRTSRLISLISLAESSDDPIPSVVAALEIFANELKPKETVLPDVMAIRLARQIGKAGQANRADAFLVAFSRDDARAVAQTEILRGTMQTKPNEIVDEESIKIPGDARDYKIGHALGRKSIARQNARVTGDVSVLLRYDGWGVGKFRPFGLVGLSLGLQDRIR